MAAITEFVVPATVLSGAATLADAAPSLMRGEPVFVPFRREIRALTSEAAVGYPLSRRVIDVPSTRVFAIEPAARLEYVMELPGDLAAVSDNDGASESSSDSWLPRVLGYVNLRELRARVNGAARDESTLKRLLPSALHDLANALTVGCAAVSALEGDIDASRAAYAALRHSAAIVNCLRELASEPRNHALETLNLAELLEELSALLRTALGPALALEIRSARTRMLVQTDRLLLERTLLNLVLNAREALPVPGRVWVSAQPGPDGFVDVFVDDDGPGISQTIAADLFAPGVSTKQGRARGFGLADAAAALRRSGGSVTLVDSRLGGASFRVRLPASS
jgi:signal transduction histidine kinase